MLPPLRARRHRALVGLLALLTCAASLLGAGLPQRQPTTEFTAAELQQGYTNTKLLALPRPGADGTHDETAEAALLTAEAAEGWELDRAFARFDGLRVLLVPAGITPAAARDQLLATGRYQFVEFNAIRQTAATPTDPSFADGAQWHHRNTGQAGGTPGADIGSLAAWDTRNDASSVIVAVIDSGARLTHQDLIPNLWTNTAEIPGNGRDDDHNGYVDDVHGINARDGSGDPSDPSTEGHGTHVSGIIGAAANNGIAGTGVAWRVQLMPLRFLGGTAGSGSDDDAIECIDYAIAHGAKVINASYGSSTYSQAELVAIRRARDAGIVFVCAAGNDGNNLDVTKQYPAGYALENIVTVGNSTRLDDISTSSNTGSGSVDLFAPGDEILSLGVTDDTATRVASGTSMASPMVAGALALLRAQYPGDNYRAAINRLLRGVRRATAFRGQALTGGRLNVADALAVTDTRPFNDDFSSRALLTGNLITVRANSVNATTESGEPAHAGRLSRSIWFTWTPATSGLTAIDTRGSIGDTTLAVYTGTTLSGLTRVVDNDNESAGFLTSRVSFQAVGGTSYHIAVDSTTAGLVSLNLSAASANDAFESAQLLDGDAPIVTTTNANATREAGEPTHFTGATMKSLWYKWEAPRDGHFQVSAYSGAVDPGVAVYTGTKLANLVKVVSSFSSGINGGNWGAVADFAATEGTTYYIALDTHGTDLSGDTTLSITDAVWQFATGDASASSSSPELHRPTITNVPAVGPDGVIYVGSSDYYFYALNPDGTLRWRVATQGYSDSSAAAIAADGTIHFGTNLGYAYALNPDGTTRWSSTLGASSYFAAPAVAADGTSYYKQDEGTLRAFSPAGAQKWTYTVAGEASYGGPAIAADGAVILPANDGALHALNPTDGARRWRYLPKFADGADDASGIYTSPSIDRAGNIYASTLSGTVFSVTADGTLRWVFRTPEAGENVSSSLALGEDRVYFASYGAYLYALNQRDGTQLWRASIEAQARASSPALASDGSVIVGSYANKLFRFSRNGELLRAWAAGNWFRSSPALANGRVYIGNGDGKLYAFDLDGVGPAAGTDYPWPQYRAGLRHLGRATVESIGQVITPVPEDPGRLVNLSVSNRTTRGDGVLTAGFVLAGDVSKELVVRGIGPTLANFGVGGVVAATELRVYRTADVSSPIATNGGWTNDDGHDLGAFALPTASDDSVVRRAFAAEPFSAQVLPRTEATAPGIALVEIYDGAIDDLRTRLTNLSARTTVAADADVAVGFVLGGQTPRRLLIRAVGPGLVPFGVTDVLSDPRLLLYAGPLAEAGNDDWNGNANVIAVAQQVGAFALDSASRDAVILTTLPPGAYSARVRGPAGQSGIVLVEVYLIPE